MAGMLNLSKINKTARSGAQDQTRPHECREGASMTSELSPITQRPLTGRIVNHSTSVGTAVAHQAKHRTMLACRRVAGYTRRAPSIWWRLSSRSPHGALRVARAALDWTLDANGAAACRAASGRGRVEGADVRAYVAAAELHRATRLRRVKIAAILAAVIAVTIAVVDVDLLAITAASAVLAPILGIIGRVEGAPIVTPPTYSTGDAPIPDAALVTKALSAIGVGELNKALREDHRALRFMAPVTRDGEGWRVSVELPPGVTAGDVVERRDRLASGLRRPSSTVWPEPDESGHEGQLTIWVGDKPLSTTRPIPWVLTDRGRTNIFAPLPFGTDQRGRPVEVTLMYASGVIGAVPRMGKTAGLRLLLLAAGLDPRVELHIANLKGGGDLEPFAPIAHYLLSDDDDDSLAEFLRDLQDIQSAMRARYRTIKQLPRERCPDAKVTDELASDRSLSLHPVVVGIDECQVAFEHDKYGAEFEAVVTDLVKRGPAVGITVLVATQRPDKQSLPTGIRSNAVLRWALRLTSQVETDMVLGTGAYKQGYRPQSFSRTDLGVGWLLGDGEKPTIARAAYVDTPTAAAICERARGDRYGLGLLTGAAAGEAVVDDRPPLLSDLAAHWPRGKRRATWDEIADALTLAGRPETAETVSAAARSAGVESVQVNRTVDGKTINRRGAALSDVQVALGRTL